MGTFLVISGFLILILFSSYRLAQRKENQDSIRITSDGLRSPHTTPPSPVAFFQLLGLLWILFGIAFVTELIHYPQGSLGILLDVLFLLLPVWAFAFYLERRDKKR